MRMDMRTEKEDYFEDFFGDVTCILEDLGQSGFRTVHDSTLRELQERGDMAAQLGMEHLSALLLSLREELHKSRHQFSSDAVPAKYYAKLLSYVALGREKTAYDRGKKYYMEKQ